MQNDCTVLQDRRSFVGGSDARIIMGDDEAARGGRSQPVATQKNMLIPPMPA
jgi:hypothetical protein